MGGGAGGSAEPPALPPGQRLPRRPPASLGLTCGRSPPRPALPFPRRHLAGHRLPQPCPRYLPSGRRPRARLPACMASHGESQPLATVPFRECEETFSERGAHGASSPRGHRTCSASSWSFTGRPWPRSRSRLRESRLGRPHSPPVHLRNARGGSIPVRRVSVHQTSWP